MKFIVDAQLPVGLKFIINNYGYEAIHTDDLPDKERTTDDQIRNLSKTGPWIVISKDSDFVDSHYIKGIPEKLLLISTGNIRNQHLYKLFSMNFNRILEIFLNCELVEMSNDEIIGYE